MLKKDWKKVFIWLVVIFIGLHGSLLASSFSQCNCRHQSQEVMEKNSPSSCCSKKESKRDLYSQCCCSHHQNPGQLCCLALASQKTQDRIHPGSEVVRDLLNFSSFTPLPLQRTSLPADFDLSKKTFSTQNPSIPFHLTLVETTFLLL